jgi:hypothetical protein
MLVAHTVTPSAHWDLDVCWRLSHRARWVCTPRLMVLIVVWCIAGRQWSASKCVHCTDVQPGRGGAKYAETTPSVDSVNNLA